MANRGMIVGLALGMFWTAQTAHAVCSSEFDGVWEAVWQVDGQCTADAFANSSATGQVFSATWTNLGDDCTSGIPATILHADYDTWESDNLTAKMIDGTTCELTFGEAVVTIDTYGAWVPLSERAWLKRVDAQQLEMCFEAEGHQLGQCFLYDYDSEW